MGYFRSITFFTTQNVAQNNRRKTKTLFIKRRLNYVILED